MTRLEELQERLTSFMENLKLVLDYDWEFTKGVINDPWYIPGTFLNPGVDDEGNNWANRGGLLESYRALVETMQELGIPVDRICQPQRSA
jgi:hypothetical protein